MVALWRSGCSALSRWNFVFLKSSEQALMAGGETSWTKSIQARCNGVSRAVRLPRG